MLGALNALNAVNRIICKFESALVFILLLTMVVLSFWQVAARNLFSKGFHWADDFLRHCVLWTGLVAASLATTEGRHIKIDILSLQLTDPLKTRVEGVISLGAAGVCFLIFRAAMEFITVEHRFAELNYALHVQTWMLEIIFPLTFGLCIFKFVVKGLNGLFTPPPNP